MAQGNNTKLSSTEELIAIVSDYKEFYMRLMEVFAFQDLSHLEGVG